MRADAGAATLLLLGAVSIGMMLVLVVADIGGYVAAGIQAATAADAAALAAAPVTFRSYGTTNTPRREAARFAEANGAFLISCRCAVDRSWRSRTVEVVVGRQLKLVLFGPRLVRAVGRAEFTPTMLH